MQLENEVHNLRGIQALLDVAGQGDLVDTNLICRQILQLVLEAELGWLILHAEVDRHDDRAWRQRCKRLDAPLRLHVHAAVVVKIERV